MIGDFIYEINPKKIIDTKFKLSPSIYKFDDEFIYSGLSAAFGHELKPNGVSILSFLINQNRSPYLQVEALSKLFNTQKEILSIQWR